MATQNQRVFFPVQAVGIGPFDASATYHTVRGVKSFGFSGKMTVEFLKEMGNLPTYASYEELPEIEITLERLLDGYCPAYLLMTDGAATADLAGRADRRHHFRASVHRDNQSRANGNQIAELFCSGAYCSSVSYNFNVNGPSMETVGAVCNSAAWTTGSYVFTGHTTAMGVSSLVPAFSQGVARRQHFDMTNSRFPTDIPGIDNTGVNQTVVISGNTQFNTSFESISVSANFGRQMAMELGRRGEFNRFVQFPIKVTSTFNFRSKGDPLITLLREGTQSNGDNTVEQTILFLDTEGLKIDLGTKNRLTAINRTGGSAGEQGDVMMSFSYENDDSLTVQHPADVTVALQP